MCQFLYDVISKRKITNDFGFDSFIQICTFFVIISCNHQKNKGATGVMRQRWIKLVYRRRAKGSELRYHAYEQMSL